ncbi:aminotransferase class I/II-fold pyridoxal phosphate-dependent enzyme [Companilactobacillus halodurans]|uniref:Aluminum resistance protein n=1 Tax=Companilactobacillus halodurans TaxID=2584183 RepID=A0A5P0ZQN7_9LACO|nr:methionine gamma-lyase family protein [Companilactobacillus halodurans]MQS76518.1 aluminum resistance protein [Companilactobacillus halodurans]MQS97033.1 aluminum resistance protein [Companilactobacillus halodurans]
MSRWNADFPDKLKSLIKDVDLMIAPKLMEIDEQVLDNQNKVLKAFRKESIDESSLLGTTGYGDDDRGRDQLEAVYADVFKTQKALVRPQFVSGTHTLATVLFGLLRPGDNLLYVTGEPYDTMQEVIGTAGNKKGSLIDYKIGFDSVKMKGDKVDFDLMKQKIKEQHPKVIAIQRSRGYSTRKSLTVSEIAEIIKQIKTVTDAIIFVDNCYGEFSETIEPTEVGADIMAGSLIKNAGGGLAKTGGYIVGKKDLVELTSYRLTAPGIGAFEGATIDRLSEMFQGFFLAPRVTGNAIKGAIFEAAIFEKLGLNVSPKWDADRTDLIQTIEFNDPDKMINFAKMVQKFSPIDSNVSPEPSAMSGYEDQVIMAAGTFVSGASIEFSCDGPMRPPYIIYIQGGLTYEHVKIAIANACKELFFS